MEKTNIDSSGSPLSKLELSNNMLIDKINNWSITSNNIKKYTNTLNCKKCNNPLKISTHQMRKSDEGMNTIYECLVCNVKNKV